MRQDASSTACTYVAFIMSMAASDSSIREEFQIVVEVAIADSFGMLMHVMHTSWLSDWESFGETIATAVGQQQHVVRKKGALWLIALAHLALRNCEIIWPHR